MQQIQMFMRTDSVKAVCVDSYNMPTEAAIPSITRGMSVEIVIGLFKDVNADAIMTSEELSQYSSFDFCLADDWNVETPVQIRVPSGIYVAEDGKLHIPIENTNTTELVEKLGSLETITLGAELIAFNAGETLPALVLQFDIAVRNRRMDSGTGTPEPTDDGQYTAAQLEALASAAPVYQFSADGQSWHDEQAADDLYFRSRSGASSNAAWSNAVMFPVEAIAAYINSLNS